MSTTLPDASGSTGATNPAETEAQMKTFIVNLRNALAEMGDPLSVFGKVQNLSIQCSVAANALTIALKDRAGADPQNTVSGNGSPASATFRNATVATGDTAVLNLTAAHSLVVSSGSTLGTRANVPFRLWFVVFNDAGTWRLGVINCLTTVAGAGSGSDVQAIYPLKAWGIAGSTAEGGAGAADSAQTFYTGTAVTAKPFSVIGYATWESGLATPGTWSAGPTRIQLFGPGVPLPGELVQQQRSQTGASATGTTVLPHDDTIPQSTEGDQYMSQAITPSSAANVLAIRAQAHVANSANVRIGAALFQDAVANALTAICCTLDAANDDRYMNLTHCMLAATSSSTTLKVRAGGGSAGTTTFNGFAGARVFGGVMNSYLEVAELMA